MRLWRLTRSAYVALDGAGAALHGTRYSPPGYPVVSFASEAGLAVLIALRYLPPDPGTAPDDFVLGWIDVEAALERAPADNAAATTQAVTDWLVSRRSLLIAVRSRVLPEADVILFNPRHPDAAAVKPLTARPFNFFECLHRPPMLARYTAPII